MDLKKLIKETLHKRLLKEDIDSIDDYFEMENDAIYDVFSDFKTHTTTKFDKIKPSMYHNALRDLVAHGKLMRFPEKYVYRWKKMVMENIAKLNAFTSIYGHTSYFPFEEFHNLFNHNEETGEDRGGEYDKWLEAKGLDPQDHEYDFGEAYEFLDEVYKIEEFEPTFSNGQSVMSDFGLEPLRKLAAKIAVQQNPKDILVTINKILDITHMRSDLAELFIEGGTKSLDFIAGFHKEEDD